MHEKSVEVLIKRLENPAHRALSKTLRTNCKQERDARVVHRPSDSGALRLSCRSQTLN
jgi:hypothetical protein